MKNIKELFKQKIVKLLILLIIIGFAVANLGIIVGYILIGFITVAGIIYGITFIEVLKAKD